MVSIANKNEKTTTVGVKPSVLDRLNLDKYRHKDETLNDTIHRILKEHEEKESKT